MEDRDLGTFAQGRLNWDRSFNAHIAVFDESKYFPAISVGLRDFIGTGWYSSEYIVATKTVKNVVLVQALASADWQVEILFQTLK